MSPRDRYERLDERLRWTVAMLNVFAADPDIQEIHSAALAGIAQHLKDAQIDLDELSQSINADATPAPPPKAANVTALRSKKRAPADDEPEHAA